MRLNYSKFRFWKNKRFLKKYRKNSRESSNESKDTKILVIATCIVAISSMATVWITWDKSSDQIEIMQGQVDEMKKANEISSNTMREQLESMNNQIKEMKISTELGFRPFLALDLDSTAINMKFISSDSIKTSRLENKHLKLTEGFIKDYSITGVQFEIMRKYSFHNIGNSPLRFKVIKYGICYSDYWDNYLKGSVNNLISGIPGLSQTQENDAVIFADSILLTDEILHDTTNISIGTALNAIENNEPICLYSVIYIQYLDLFDRPYSVLLVHDIPITIIDSQFTIISKFGTEKYRWDLFPQDTLQ